MWDLEIARGTAGYGAPWQATKLGAITNSIEDFGGDLFEKSGTLKEAGGLAFCAPPKLRYGGAQTGPAFNK